jgi:hypothetical protein
MPQICDEIACKGWKPQGSKPERAMEVEVLGGD